MAEFIAKVLVALLAVASATAWARPLADIKKSGTIRLCFVRWSSAADGSDQRNGPDYEVAVAFAKEIGVTVEAKELRGFELFADASGEIDKSSAEPTRLADGTCDFYAANITINDWRLRKVDIVPVYPGKTMIMVRSTDKDRFRSLADLGGKTTIYRKGTTYQTWVEEQNRSILKETPIVSKVVSVAVPVRHLLEQEVDFMMYDTLIALYLIGHTKDRVKMAFPVGPNELLGWGFRKSDKTLSDAVTQFLQRQRTSPDSDMNRIFKEYFQVAVRDYEDIVYASQSAEK